MLTFNLPLEFPFLSISFQKVLKVLEVLVVVIELYMILCFFLLTIMKQQKRLERSNTLGEKRDVIILDFMSK
jgi:hypothetical protein